MPAIHRTATIPPAGPARHGKRLVLCGYYAAPGTHTTDNDAVTCRTCIRATTSVRTIERRRLA